MNDTNTDTNVTAPTQTSTRRVGRPRKHISWPQTPFTINDLKNSGLSRVSLQIKVKEALDEQKLKVSGDTKGTKKGRPSTVYQIV